MSSNTDELLLKILQDLKSKRDSESDKSESDQQPEKKKRAIKKLRQVSLEDVCTEGFESESDDTVLRFIILHIRKAHLKYVKTYYAGKQSKWSGSPNQSYDRIVTAADLSDNKGSCFCFLYCTQKESDYKLMKFKMSNCGVGEIGEVVEPLYLKKNLGSSDLPILEHKKPLIHIPNIGVVIKNIPEVQFMERTLPKVGTRFFLVKNAILHVQNAIVEDPICTGYMCDRQEEKKAEGVPCGCLVQSDRCNVVLSCNLFVKDKEKQELFFVRNFRSWVFTKLLFGTSLSDLATKADYNEGEMFETVRQHLSVIIDYVNSNGGWSIVGWFRIGMLQDAGDVSQDLPRNQTELIAAETVTPHVCRLCPSDIKVSELYQFQLHRRKINFSTNVTNAVSQEERNSLLKTCENCHRCAVSTVEMNMSYQPSSKFNLRRKLCGISRHRPRYIWICEECAVTLDRNTTGMNWSYIWPSYFWKLFTDNILYIVDIWRWIPQNWRPMWMDSLAEYEVLLREDSTSFFVDITVEVRQLQEDLASMTLVRLKDCLNRHPYCSVKCPWGCDEFPEVCDHLPFYAFLVMNLAEGCPNIKFPLWTDSILYGDKKKFSFRKKLVGIRPDYLTTITFLLDNPQWPIRPSLRIISGFGPMVLVCPRHKNGSSVVYVHVPTHPVNSNLPSIEGSKLAHATICPRTVQAIKLHNYSNTYQLVTTQGSFSGIDSCYLVENARYDSNLSPISLSDEILFLNLRRDVRSHLKYLMESQQFPYDIGKQKLKASLDIFPDMSIKLSKSLQGSSYVSLFDTLLLEKNMQTASRSSQDVSLPWIPFLMTCHPSGRSYGTSILYPPEWRNRKDYRLLWILSCLLLNNNILWSLLTDYSLSTEEDNWAGWILKYVSGSILRKKVKRQFTRYEQKRNIHQTVYTIDSVAEQTGLENSIWLAADHRPNFYWRQLSSLFQPIDNVAILDLENCSVMEVEEFLCYIQDVGIKLVLIFLPCNSFLETGTNEEGATHPLTNSSLLSGACEDTVFNFSEIDFIYSYMNNKIWNNVRAPLNVCVEDKSFELCAAMKSDESALPCAQWDVQTKLRRMFTDDLNAFWNVGRDGKPYLLLEEDYLNVTDFHFLLYVKKVNLVNVQQDYLFSMGNQCVVKCPLHHKHLVSSGYRCGKKCSYQGSMNKICGRMSIYECPLKLCEFHLCKKHYQVEFDVEEEDEETLPLNSLCSTNTMDAELLVQDEFGDDNKSSEESNVTGELYPTILTTDALDNEDSICSSTDSLSEENLFLGEPVNSDRSDDDEDLSSDSKDEGDSICSLVLPTTDTSRHVHYLKESTASSIPLTVLFNKHLHVLIRRNYELKASKKMKGFLERIVATSENDTVPLLYPEGMLFPHIFYHQREDGSIDGCIPAPLWNSDKVVHSYGFASIIDHMRSRITNSALRCSTEPTYLFFAFDAISNSSCHEDYPQLILSRGYEHMLRTASIHGFEKEDSFQSHQDMIDPRKTVQELAGFLREYDATYFYTHTCNVREHFGVAPLQRWVDSQIQELRNDSALSEFQFQQMERSYHQRLAVPLTRSWFRAGNYYMNYICHSPEQPLGPIQKFWYKWEDNDKTAALQHLHAILVSLEDKNDSEDLRQIQSRVVCNSLKAMDISTLQPLFDEGLLLNTEDSIQRYYNYIKLFQEHGKCSSHNYSCHRRTGLMSHETQCRVPHYGKENPSPNIYSYVHINPNHSSATRELLQKCHLLSTVTTESGATKDVYLNPMLDSGMYFYPAIMSEHLSPFNPRLFASHYSSDCLKICNRAMSSHYLAKYNTLVDKSLEVTIHPGTERGELRIEAPYKFNTKITSSRFYEQQLQREKKENCSTSGRKIGLPQAIALMLQIPQVYTNATFIHLPTAPLEQRAGILVKPLPTPSTSNPFPRYVPLNTGSDTPEILYRESHFFPPERMFTTLEKIIISDTLSCPDSIDKITLFAIRPPELRFVQSVQRYYQWFIRTSSNDRIAVLILDIDFFKCAWVNGVGHHIKIRAAAIPSVLGDASCPTSMRLLLYSLIHNDQYRFFSATQHTLMKNLFLHEESNNDSDLPIIVLPPVKPTQTNRFIIHLLLSLGSYSNELQLFNVRSIVESFRNARLLHDNTPETPATVNDVIDITKRYIAEQLFFIPSGTKTFDRYAVAAFQAINAVLLESSILSFDIPSFLYTSLVAAADQRCLDFQKELRYTLIETMKSEPNAPPAVQLHSATKVSPLAWRPHITQLPDQSDASYREHQYTSETLQHAIDTYIAGGCNAPSSIIIVGGPGTGKTFQMKQACLYALSQGLNVLTSSLMSERAIVLGCRHLHYLFCVPGYEFSSIHRLTDHIIKNLNQKPMFCYALQTNDVICLDEMEFVPSEFFNVLDNVLRYIRNKKTLFGGMLVVATMDPQQLPPVEGHPCLTSSIILTSFRLLVLNEYVRSRTDSNLQRTITLIRKLQPLTQEEMEEFIHLVITYCTHVNSWGDPHITADTIRILGTRKGVHTAETTYYDRIQQQGLIVLSRRSEDFENLKTSHGTWKSASTRVVNSLNKIVREPELLQLHQGLIVELTYNNGTKWSNGQIAIITELPQQETLDRWKPFPVLLAPVGVRTLPSDPYTFDTLTRRGWKKVEIKVCPDKSHHCFGGMFGKRHQYGIRPLAATTVHKAMGNDYDKIVSCVINDGLSGFRLWEKAQVLVLISRVHRMQDIIFVGDKEETARQLLQIITVVPKYALYIDYIINCLTSTPTSPPLPVINLSSTLPFHIQTTECPKVDEVQKGYCYLIISIPRPQTTYIGQTENLQRRLYQHNSGWSTQWTDDISYRPWVYFAYVVGFLRTSQRKRFESLWQHLVEISYPNQTATPLQVLQTCELAISKYHEEFNVTSDIGKLRLIQLLSLTS